MSRLTPPLGRPRPCLHKLLLGATLVLQAGLLQPLMGGSSQAHAEQLSKSYSVAPGSLGVALNQFAQEAGVVLSFDAALTKGRQSAGLHGQYSVEEGFYTLLGDNDIQVIKVGANYLLTEKTNGDSAIQLEATSINADRLGDITENSGSFTTGSAAVGSKVATSLKEVPHSVSVMTRQRLDDQNLTSLTDVMDKTTGVTHSRASQTAGSSLGNDSNFYSRGFQVNNIQIDSGAPMDTVMVGFGSVSQLDMVQFDHVEFLRGVDGLYSGSGDPGGTINLVRKRALDHNQLTFSTSAGSWDNYRSELDVTGPLNQTGSIRGRLGAAYQDRKFFYSPGNMKTKVLYGSMEFDVTPDTLLTLGGSYQEQDGVSNFSGLPRYANGADLKLSRRTSLTTDWNHTHETTKQGFIRIKHDFTQDWGITLDAMRMEMDRDAMGVYSIGAVDPSDNTGTTFWAFPAKTGMDRTGYSATIKGGFGLFDMYHDVVIGADYQKGNSWTEQYTTLSDGTPVDVFNPQLPAGASFYPTKDDYHITKKKSLFAMTRLSITDALKLSIGGRVADYSYESDSPYYKPDGSPNGALGLREIQDTGVFTPYAGLTYDINQNWTAYTSYAETFRPQYQERTRDNGTLAPVESKNYEVGLKGEFFEGRLNTALSLYRAVQENVAVADGPVEYNRYKGYLCCFVSQGQTISQGIDAEISGELKPGWQLISGYTYNHSRDKDSNTANYRNITPKHLFKLWTTYQLPGPLQEWKIGAGAIAQSSNYVSGTTYAYNPSSGRFDGDEEPFKFVQATYTIWSGSIDYKIDEHWSATLNANNIFDKRYYQTVGDTSASNFYGEPRNFAVTLRSKF